MAISQRLSILLHLRADKVFIQSFLFFPLLTTHEAAGFLVAFVYNVIVVFLWQTSRFPIYFDYILGDKRWLHKIVLRDILAEVNEKEKLTHCSLSLAKLNIIFVVKLKKKRIFIRNLVKRNELLAFEIMMQSPD